MAFRLSPSWMQEIRQKISAAKRGESFFEVHLSAPITKKFVVTCLLDAGVPYKIHNAGAGVSIITTKTDECPCCKRKLK